MDLNQFPKGNYKVSKVSSHDSDKPVWVHIGDSFEGNTFINEFKSLIVLSEKISNNLITSSVKSWEEQPGGTLLVKTKNSVYELVPISGVDDNG